ncbi:hypothetical protein L3X38_004411 [Prunus dulcis]|uniref:Uncharacterized protein n=1 Tax=Prunus dulcis TaxID=3755 RepID=A0AAD4ZNU3_PRUDU|nr:hypothetical protein L3X38_004411 [Prunus dulcis]
MTPPPYYDVPKFSAQSDIDWSMKSDNSISYEVRSEMEWLVYCIVLKFQRLDLTQNPPSDSSHHIMMFPKIRTQSDIDWSMKLDNSDTLAKIGQRLERLKSNTFENSVSPSAQTSSVEEDSSSSSPASVDSFDNSKSDREEEVVDNNDENRALEDYAQLVIPNSPSCILLPTEARNYNLKSSHFHMLPSFYGLPNEDPLAHIKEFYNVVSGLPLQGVSEAI